MGTWGCKWYVGAGKGRNCTEEVDLSLCKATNGFEYEYEPWLAAGTPLV